MIIFMSTEMTAEQKTQIEMIHTLVLMYDGHGECETCKAGGTCEQAAAYEYKRFEVSGIPMSNKVAVFTTVGHVGDKGTPAVMERKSRTIFVGSQGGMSLRNAVRGVTAEGTKALWFPTAY